jgi:hypothetical protein
MSYRSSAGIPPRPVIVGWIVATTTATRSTNHAAEVIQRSYAPREHIQMAWRSENSPGPASKGEFRCTESLTRRGVSHEPGAVCHPAPGARAARRLQAPPRRDRGASAFVQAKAGHAEGSTTERYLHAAKTITPTPPARGGSALRRGVESWAERRRARRPPSQCARSSCERKMSPCSSSMRRPI